MCEYSVMLEILDWTSTHFCTLFRKIKIKIENNSHISRNCLLIFSLSLSRFQHLLPTSRRLPMVQQAMSAATRAGATNEESLHFLETIFSTPDLGVLALEVWILNRRLLPSLGVTRTRRRLLNFLEYDLTLQLSTPNVLKVSRL